MSAAAADDVGLCGCGNMGAAIAARLGPHTRLRVFDVDAERRDEVARSVGAEAVEGLDGLAAARCVVLSLPNSAISSSVVDTLLTVLAPGAVIVETSTVSPDDAVAAAQRCAAAGIRFVDAAILSGVDQMSVGTTTLLIGGADEDVRLAQPVLDAMAPDQVRLGAAGTGMAAKVGNNAVSHAVMVVLVEAMSMVTAAGVPFEVFADLLARPDGGLQRPLNHRLRERVATGRYGGGMPTDAARKDSTLALELAQRHRVPLFAIQAAHTPYELAVADGLGRDDYAAIAKLWQAWTGRALAGDGGGDGNGDGDGAGGARG